MLPTKTLRRKTEGASTEPLALPEYRPCDEAQAVTRPFSPLIGEMLALYCHTRPIGAVPQSETCPEEYCVTARQVIQHILEAYCRDGRMVGYAVLGPESKASRASGTFRRWVFWLLPHDRDTVPKGLYRASGPSEGVDPRTLAPGTKGRKTERSEGGPPSTAMQELGVTLPL